MLIVNADDWGGWRTATDAALHCYQQGRITSVTAMVFMEDSERAARIALAEGMPVGLHLNFNQRFSAALCPHSLFDRHARVSRFLNRGKYCQLFYNPFLRDDFRAVVAAQHDEFARLYGRPPTHVDGHRHLHLCANMLLDRCLPTGIRVRRSFSFWPGEKSALNRTYRRLVDRRLRRFYKVADFFFALSQCANNPRFDRVVDLARRYVVELMTHPEVPVETEFLQSDHFGSTFAKLRVGSYADI